MKNSFSCLCLFPGVWAMTDQETCSNHQPLHPSASLCQGGSSSGRHAGACSLLPCLAGMTICLQPFPIRKQARDSEPAWKDGVEVPHRDSWRWFYCQRDIPTGHSDTGGKHEKELWIHIEYMFIPSAASPSLSPYPPSSLSLCLSLSSSFTSSEHL